MAEKKKTEINEAEENAKKESLAKKIRKASITEVAHKIRDCRTEKGKRCDEARFAMFLGAGASFQSKIKTAGQMMTEFRERILSRECPDITDKKKQETWLEKNVLSKGNGNEYSKLFEAFERTPRGRQNYISKLIKDKDPSFGYAMLASLIARNFINTILTTNFDDLVFVACSKFTGVRPVIYAYGIMATEMKFNTPHPKILKMHGDYLYSALANTEREMSLFNQEPNMKSQVSQTLNEYELILFGYSGSDNSVMEILENYPNNKELYWCHWEKELPSLRALELLKEKDGTLIPIEGFDEAMYEIYKVVDFELDDVLASYEERRKEVLRFIDQFDKKYANPVIEETIEESKQTKSRTETEPETWYEYITAGYYAGENKNFAKAEKYYRKAIELNPNYSIAYQNLGVLLSKDKKSQNEAEKMFLKAIESDLSNSFPYYNLACLRSLSGKEENKEEAFKFLKKAIELDLIHKEEAKTDSDFDFIRDDPRFKKIVGD